MSTLVIMTQPPYQSRLAHEQLEAIMSLALFDIEHRVVFLGDGLLWLIPGQYSKNSHSIDKQLQALPLYGSDSLHFVKEDKEAILGSSNVNDTVSAISRAELVQWIADAQNVEVF